MNTLIEKGSNWEHVKTGKRIIVIDGCDHPFQKVKILHQSGKSTVKGAHYFLAGYRKLEVI